MDALVRRLEGGALIGGVLMLAQLFAPCIAARRAPERSHLIICHYVPRWPTASFV